MSYQKKTIQLFFRSGTSDKQYNITVEASGSGYIVYAMYGRRGSATKRELKTPSPVSLLSAERTYSALIEDKYSKKGYTTHLSGTPHGGIDFNTEVIVPLPASTAAPVSPSVREKLKPQPWKPVAQGQDIEVILGLEGTSIQAMPAGVRVLTYQSSSDGVTIDVADGKAVALSTDVLAEVLATFPGYVLDGFYEAGQFIICDGYKPETKPQLFANRIATIMDAFKKTRKPLKHIKAQPAFFGSEVDEALCVLADPATTLLLRTVEEQPDRRFADSKEVLTCSANF